MDRPRVPFHSDPVERGPWETAISPKFPSIDMIHLQQVTRCYVALIKLQSMSINPAMKCFMRCYLLSSHAYPLQPNNPSFHEQKKRGSIDPLPGAPSAGGCGGPSSHHRASVPQPKLARPRSCCDIRESWAFMSFPIKKADIQNQ